MRQCTKCKEWKEETEFYKLSHGKSGLHSWCKLCHNKNCADYFRKRLQTDPEFHKEFNNNQRERSRKKRRDAGIPERIKNPLKEYLLQQQQTCRILREHVNILREDPERLTTDFIKKIAGIKKEECQGIE